MYVDSHAHLDGPKFDTDREPVLARAREAGVEAIVAVGSGTGPGTLDCGIRIAERYDQNPQQSSAEGGRATSQHSPRIYATIGIHPHEAKLATDADFRELAELAKHPRVIAWGEIGLDYFYDHSPRHVQRAVFLRQLELAEAAKLPVVIHNRPSENSENAWEDCLGLLREHWAPSGLGGVLHCFTGQVKHAQAALDMGFMVSFAGNVTFPKAQNIRDAAKAVPLERMLIETDCPYLAPVPHRGQRNEPAFVRETARQIGELRGMSAEEVAERTAENFYRFFGVGE